MTDAAAAFETATASGATAVQPPVTLHDEATGTSQCMAEVKMYGDVVLRFVSGSYKVRAWLHLAHIEPCPALWWPWYLPAGGSPIQLSACDCPCCCSADGSAAVAQHNPCCLMLGAAH